MPLWQSVGTPAPAWPFWQKACAASMHSSRSPACMRYHCRVCGSGPRNPPAGLHRRRASNGSAKHDQPPMFNFGTHTVERSHLLEVAARTCTRATAMGTEPSLSVLLASFDLLTSSTAKPTSHRLHCDVTSDRSRSRLLTGPYSPALILVNMLHRSLLYVAGRVPTPPQTLSRYQTNSVR